MRKHFWMVLMIAGVFMFAASCAPITPKKKATSSAKKVTKTKVAVTLSPGDGKMEGDTFVRTNSPAFTIDLPGFESLKLKGNNIYRGQGPGRIPTIVISVWKEDNVDEALKNDAQDYADSLKLPPDLGKRIKIVSNEPIDNYDDFKAYQYVIEWSYRGGMADLVSTAQVIAKEGYFIQLSVTNMGDVDAALALLESMDLDP